MKMDKLKNKPVGFSKKQVLESMEQLRRTAEREPRFSTKIRGLAQVPSRLRTSMVSRQSRRCPIFCWKRLLDLNHFSALVHSVSAVASFAELPYPEPDMVPEHRICDAVTEPVDLPKGLRRSAILLPDLSLSGGSRPQLIGSSLLKPLSRSNAAGLKVRSARSPRESCEDSGQMLCVGDWHGFGLVGAGLGRGCRYQPRSP